MKRKPQNPRDILFVCLGGIGDLLFVTPALQILSRAFPAAHYHFLLAKGPSRQVVESHPRCGTIVEVDASAGSFPAIILPLRRLNIDCVFAATGTNPLICGMIGMMIGSRYRAGERFGAGRLLYNCTVPYEASEHEVPANCRIAAALAGNDPSPPPPCTVWTTAAHARRAEEWMRGEAGSFDSTVGMHLGAGAAARYKRWPHERFVELAQTIARRHNARIAIFGGPDEREASGKAAARIGPRALNLAGMLCVQESYAAMKQCRVFISADTGPLHLAAAAGCRLIALFGPTLAGKTGPWGEDHVIIHADMPCRPCYRYRDRHAHCRTIECMRAITVERVFGEFVKLLGPVDALPGGGTIKGS